jgi:hypothetical protein
MLCCQDESESSGCIPFVGKHVAAYIALEIQYTNMQVNNRVCYVLMSQSR